MAMVKIKGTDMGLWTNVYILFYIQGELDLIVSKAHLKRTFHYLTMDTRNGNRTQNHVKATVLTNMQTKEYRYETYNYMQYTSYSCKEYTSINLV